MKHILLRTTMALALSVAGGLAFAQTQQPNTGTDQSTGAMTPKTEGQDQAPSTNNETTGAIGNVNVTAEQKTEIRHIITQTKVEPAHVDFDVAIGTTIPRTVKIHRLPERIVKVVPAYRHYEYFVLEDGRIAIVDPGSLKIVAVLEA